MTKRSTAYLIAGLPAFYLPLSYLVVVIWVAVAVVTRQDMTPREGTFMWWIGWSGIYGTLLQWPFYICWALLSRELSWRLRARWVAVLVLLNMLAIPYFLLCKYRGETKKVVLRLWERESANCDG